MRFVGATVVAVLSSVSLVESQQVVFASAGQDLQPLVDAAAPGDTIYVPAGQYPPFAIDKGVQVIGAGSSTTFVSASASCDGDSFVGKVLDVDSVPAGETCLVSGFTFEFEQVVGALGQCTPGPSTAVVVENVGGVVVLDDVVVRSEGETLRVRSVSILVTEECQFTADTKPGLGANLATSNAVVSIERSEAWLQRTVIDTRLVPPLAASGVLPRGLEAVDARLYLADTRVLGGGAYLGGSASCTGPVGLPGSTGIELLGACELRVVGLDAEIRGGAAAGDLSCPAAGGIGIQSTTSSLIELDIQSRIAGGFGAPSDIQSPAVLGGPYLTLLQPRPVLIADFTPTGVFVSSRASAASAVVVTYSSGLGPVTALPAFDGASLLDLTRLQFLTVLTLGPEGTGSTLLPPLPAPPSLLGLTVFLQGLEFTVGGERQLTNVAVLPVRP